MNHTERKETKHKMSHMLESKEGVLSSCCKKAQEHKEKHTHNVQTRNILQKENKQFKNGNSESNHDVLQ